MQNINAYLPFVKSKHNTLGKVTDIQFVANTSDPSDSDLAAGRLHYLSGTGLRWYDGSTWYTIPTSSSGGGLSAWDSMYALDKTLTISSTTLTFDLTHATGDGLTLSGSAGSAGQLLQFANSGSGLDVQGTGDVWSISSAGAATFVGITPGGDITTTAAAYDWDLVDNNASALSFDAAGKAGIIAIVTTNSSEGVTMSGTLTVAGALTASVGLTSSDGACTFTDNSNAANGITFVNDTVTTYGNATDAGPVHFNSSSLTTGHLLTLSLSNTALAGGSYLRCWEQDGGDVQFSIGEDGLTTIAGTAIGTDALVITDGDILLTSGNLDITTGDVALADSSLTIVDADNAATLSVTNSTATSESPFAFIGAGAFTGTTTKSWMTLTAAGLTTGTQIYGVAAALTQGKLLHLTTGATQTSGSILYVQNTSASSAMTSGTVATFDHTSTAVGASVNKIGSVVSITSSRTVNTGGTTADDFDLLSLVKTTTRTAGTAATAGSVLYVQLVSTGTVTETSKGIEVVMDSGGTGAGIDLTHAATGGVALNVVGAATTVDDVLITGSGAKASAKASLQVVNSGNTAAGGSILRVASGASTPAAATSYLAEFTYAASTMTNNPVTMQINSGASTGAAVNVTGSGVGYSLLTSNTNTSAVGVKWGTSHLAGSSEADNDVVFTMDIGGADDAHAAEIFAKILVTAIDVSAADPDGKLDFQIDVAGTPTSMLYLQSSTAGATTMVCAAAASTFGGSAAGTAAVTVTNGDISLSAGKFISTTTADIYGLDVTVNRAAATQGVAVFTNASTTSAKHVLELEQADLDEPYIKFSGSTAITSATAGANGDVPAQVVGYLLVDVDGTDRKIPYYAT